MCFSAPVSFIAGTVLSSAGVITLKQTKKPKEIPLALIPLLLGIQQLIEGFVWLSLSWGLPKLNLVTTYGFVFFSHVLWPVFVPLAVFLVETVPWRKKAIIACGTLGAAVSLYLLSLIILFPVSSQITCNSIGYFFPSPQLSFPVHAIFYIIATCLSCLLSSHRLIKLLGIAVVISLIISYYFYTATFASVWCFFSALLSVIIYLFFKDRNKLKRGKK